MLSHLSADAAMPRRMRTLLSTSPEAQICVKRVAIVQIWFSRLYADGVVDDALQAMLRGPVSRTDMVDIAGERAIGDAVVWTDTITTKSCDRIENRRGRRLASLLALVPVRLRPLITALLAKQLFVRVYEKTMEGEERPLVQHVRLQFLGPSTGTM